jgi:hypothetical protein
MDVTGTPSPIGDASPANDATANASPTLSATQTPAVPEVTAEEALTASDGASAPFFSQNYGGWGALEYDHSYDGYNGCPGPTIAQCGCAMTSLANVLATYQVFETPDGRQLDPGTFNDWLSGNAQFDGTGWLSRGYRYGGVVWLTVAEVSAAANRRDPNAKIVEYRTSSWGSQENIINELTADLSRGLPAVVGVRGHFVFAVGLADDGDILIKDPYYPDRTRLSYYTAIGRVVQGVHFKPSDGDLSGIMLTVPSYIRIRVTDRQGRVTGTLEDGDARNVGLAAPEGIPGSEYVFEEAWRDPTCISKPPKPGQGTNTVILASGTRLEDVTIDVVNTEGDGTTIGVHEFDKDGNSTIRSLIDPNESTSHGGGSGQDDSTSTPTPSGRVLPDPVTVPPVTPQLISPVVITPIPTTAVPPPTWTPMPPTRTPMPPPLGFLGDAASSRRWFDVNNGYRTGAGLPPFVRSGILDACALEHTQFVLQNRWWEKYNGTTQIHFNFQGLDQYDRCVARGYNPGAVIGENVGWGTLGLTEAQIFYDYLLKLPHEDPADPDWGANGRIGVACLADASFRVCVAVYASP